MIDFINFIENYYFHASIIPGIIAFATTMWYLRKKYGHITVGELLYSLFLTITVGVPYLMAVILVCTMEFKFLKIKLFKKRR